MMPSEVRLYVIDMLKALHYCHKVIQVIHRDIKPDNIMINHNNEAVLIDFGVSAIMNETGKHLLDRNMGTYMMFAPETFGKKTSDSIEQRGEKTDMWALGITIFYLLVGRFPCQDALNPLHLRDLIIHRPINFDLIKQEYPREMLKLMLEKDPLNRASIDDIMQSNWITNNGQEKYDFEIDRSPGGFGQNKNDDAFGNLARALFNNKRKSNDVEATFNC